MPLSEDGVVEQVKRLMEVRDADRSRLDRIHDYMTNQERFEWLPRVLPEELRKLAKVSRVNVLRFVVNTAVQSMFVDGYRAPRQSADVPAWEIWQRNRFDARQIGVHRAGIAYGASYVTVLPGEPVPVMRGASPRSMTVVYGSDDDWPEFALERRRDGSWRLLDDEAVYVLEIDDRNRNVDGIQVLSVDEHGAGVTPVIRYRETDDLDDEVIGLVEPLIDLQDQINITTFGLQVAQHYGAFRQRWIIGWVEDSQEEKLKAQASKLWTFDEDPANMKIGEFSETELKGYLDSREATLRHLSTVSQTPAHELLGQLVNLSAEALAAAEAGHRRAINEYQTVMGESHEQSLSLGSEIMAAGEVDPAAFTRWRDTESRALGMLVDALGKAVQMLGIPPEALWDRVADAVGASQQEVEQWRRMAREQAERDPVAEIARQMSRNGSSEPVSVGP